MIHLIFRFGLRVDPSQIGRSNVESQFELLEAKSKCLSQSNLSTGGQEELMLMRVYLESALDVSLPLVHLPFFAFELWKIAYEFRWKRQLHFREKSCASTTLDG